MDATQSMIAGCESRAAGARRGALLQVASAIGHVKSEPAPEVPTPSKYNTTPLQSAAKCPLRRATDLARVLLASQFVRWYHRAAMFCVPPVTAPSRAENGSAGSVSAPDAAPAPTLEKKQSTPPPEDRKVAKAMTQLNRTCDELIETESTYVSMLETIVDVYLVPLRTWAQEDASRSTSANKVDSITPAEVERLFGSVETLLSINRELLDKLRTTADLVAPNDPAARAAALAKTLATAAAGPLRFCHWPPLEPTLAILQMS